MFAAGWDRTAYFMGGELLENLGVQLIGAFALAWARVGEPISSDHGV